MQTLTTKPRERLLENTKNIEYLDIIKTRKFKKGPRF
jgi:hypothetical protein